MSTKNAPTGTPVAPLVMRPDRCEKCRQYKDGFCDQTGETTKPDWSCEDFMGHICMECGWDIRTRDVLQRLYDKMCPKDSYGVNGSDFQTCRMCHTGGSPTRPWKHADSCEMKEVEEFLFGLGEFDA